MEVETNFGGQPIIITWYRLNKIRTPVCSAGERNMPVLFSAFVEKADACADFLFFV